MQEGYSHSYLFTPMTGQGEHGMLVILLSLQGNAGSQDSQASLPFQEQVQVHYESSEASERRGPCVLRLELFLCWG